MKKLLLHCCCGPCAAPVIENLSPEFDITALFYNPCITDQGEFEKRWEGLVELTIAMGRGEARKVTAPPEVFFSFAAPFADEPEGGRRCELCFANRLGGTAKIASAEGYDCFATTLAISPHKNRAAVERAGRAAAKKFGATFITDGFSVNAGGVGGVGGDAHIAPTDAPPIAPPITPPAPPSVAPPSAALRTERDAYQRSIALSKKYNLYRQNFCGCEYSRRD